MIWCSYMFAGTRKSGAARGLIIHVCGRSPIATYMSKLPIASRVLCSLALQPCVCQNGMRRRFRSIVPERGSREKNMFQLLS